MWFAKLYQVVPVHEAIKEIDDYRNLAEVMRDEDESGRANNILPKKVFVGNISYRVTWKQLFTFFKKFGRVRECHLPKDHLKGLPKGFAFVTFWNKAGAQKALNATEEELTFDDRVMRVHPAEESKRSSFKVYESIPTFSQQHWRSQGEENDEIVGVSEDEDSWSELNGVELAETVDLHDSAQVDLLTSRLTELQQKRTEEMRDEKEDTYSKTSIDCLYQELLAIIFGYLNVRERVRVELVSHRWRDAALESWKRQEVLQFQNVFKRFGGITDRILNSLLQRCGKYLKCLDMSTSPRFLSDYGVELIGKNCPQLERLNLSRVDATNTSIKNLSSGCPKLKEVYLQSCFHIGEKGLWWLFHSCPELEVIDLQMNCRITGQCFHMLGPRLREVNIYGCTKLTDAAIIKLAEKCSNLEALTVQLMDSSLDILSTKFSKLTKLDVSDSHQLGNASALCLLGKIKSLEELSLKNTRAVTDDVLISISQGCVFLEVLDVSLCSTHVTDLGVMALARLGRLHTLNISYLHQVYCESIIQIALNGRLKKIIARACSSLEDKSMKVLAEQCYELYEVDLSGIFNITNETLVTFTLLHGQDTGKKLELYLGGTSVEFDKVTAPETIKVYMDDLSQYHLRPDNELLLPSVDKESEDDGEADEFSDYADEDTGYLLNDDPLEEERWNLS